jgi:hypothetical protein
MENFYYSTIYDILRESADHNTTAIALKRLKAQIIRLHSQELHSIYLDNAEQDAVNGEEPTMYHIIKAKKRQTNRTITHITDDQGMVQTNQETILRTFDNHMRTKYEPIPIQEEAYGEIIRSIQRTTTREENDNLELPITEDEIMLAVEKGKPNKAPGNDGISQSFFKSTWSTIHHEIHEMINQQYTENTTTATQKQGIIVFIPKTKMPTRPSDYKPLTLLNSDLKILTRVIANRLTPILTKILSTNQHCGLQNSSILQAVATVRDTIAYVEATNTPMCVVTIDFKEAFDNVSHEYIFKLLQRYGFSDKFQQRIRQLHTDVKSNVRINGYTAPPIPIECSIRQGCPLSILLYVLCIDPLIRTLENTLTGVRIGKSRKKSIVTAYADDVTIFLTTNDDIPRLEKVIRNYTAASGAKLNTEKSTALPIGSWNTNNNILNIPYKTETRILGTHFNTTIKQTVITSWAMTTQKLRARAQDNYNRDLSMINRIQYVQNILMAQIWYAAQILPIPQNSLRQINTTISWFLWHGNIFRLPLTTLQLQKHRGGWGMTNVAAKSRSLLFCRLQKQGQHKNSITADWFRYWKLITPSPNPPDISHPEAIRISQMVCI